jgi:hypothetical protein
MQTNSLEQIMIRELIDTEVEAVVGGLFDFQALIQNIDAHQTANANGGNARGLFAVGGNGGLAFNVGGTNTNAAQNGG